MTTDTVLIERALLVMAIAMSVQTLLFVGAAIGASVAEVAPETFLRVGFAVLMLLIAAQLLRGVWKSTRAAPADARAVAERRLRRRAERRSADRQ